MPLVDSKVTNLLAQLTEIHFILDHLITLVQGFQQHLNHNIPIDKEWNFFITCSLMIDPYFLDNIFIKDTRPSQPAKIPQVYVFSYLYSIIPRFLYCIMQNNYGI